jgi:hypothetical protein
MGRTVGNRKYPANTRCGQIQIGCHFHAFGCHFHAFWFVSFFTTADFDFSLKAARWRNEAFSDVTRRTWKNEKHTTFSNHYNSDIAFRYPEPQTRGRCAESHGEYSTIDLYCKVDANNDKSHLLGEPVCSIYKVSGGVAAAKTSSSCVKFCKCSWYRGATKYQIRGTQWMMNEKPSGSCAWHIPPHKSPLNVFPRVKNFKKSNRPCVQLFQSRTDPVWLNKTLNLLSNSYPPLK